MNKPTVGSLFAGIGGIDLGLEWAGFQTAWFCEQDDYCRRVLERHWPGVPCFSDVKEMDERAPRVDVIAAGFPCQPVSVAGRQLAQDDPRWLWPEVGRLIRLLRPRGVLLENVPGLLARGFSDVIGDLATSGYDAEWDCIPASAVGAPHRRDRVFIVAYPAKLYSNGGDDHAGKRLESSAVPESGNGGWANDVADTNGAGSQTHREPVKFGTSGHAASGRANAATSGRRASVWASEPDVGRVANGVPNRVDRLRALGNAVVPQVAEVVGRRLMEVISG